MDPVKEFYTDLSRILEPYKDNLQNLADETGVSKVSLLRWKNGINKNYPDVNKILPVLVKVSGLNKTRDVGNFFGGYIEKFVNDFLPIYSSENYQVIDKSSSTDFIPDFYSFIIILLCGTESGVSKFEIEGIIGNLAVQKLGLPRADITDELIKANGVIARKRIAELLEKEFIYCDADGVYSLTQKDINLNVSHLKEYLPMVMENFLKPEEYSKGYNAIFTYTESIPLDLANELARDTKDFFEKSYKKMQERKDKNGIPYTIINFSERLWFGEREPLQKGGK